MNYFELFGLPVQLKTDKKAIKRRYLELSKKNHPDYFVNTSVEEQQKAEESFALLNQGLKTLTADDETIKYVLKLKGLVEEEEKYTLSPGFLMQMMEINEQLAEMEFEEDPAKKVELLQSLNELEKEIYEPVENIIENYKEGVTSEEELLQVKDYYFKKKYINRLRQQLGGKL